MQSVTAHQPKSADKDMESRGHWQELTKQRVQKPSVPDDLDHPMHVPLQDLIHVAGVVLLGYD
jgi:hypothetical protein